MLIRKKTVCIVMVNLNSGSEGNVIVFGHSLIFFKQVGKIKK